MKDTNNQRAAFAANFIELYMERAGVDQECALPDLLADLMHWADSYGRDFADDLRRATNHYTAELTEEVEA